MSKKKNKKIDEKYFIRNFRAEDYEALMELWEVTNLGNKKRGDTLEIILSSIDMGGELLIIEEKTSAEIIGCSWITFDGRRMHLHHIGVKPSHQNQGLGKRITEKSILYAKKKGYQIKLEVLATNSKAIEIYKKTGFKRLGDYDIYIIRNFDELGN